MADIIQLQGSMGIVGLTPGGIMGTIKYERHLSTSLMIEQTELNAEAKYTNGQFSLRVTRLTFVCVCVPIASQRASLHFENVLPNYANSSEYLFLGYIYNSAKLRKMLVVK